MLGKEGERVWWMKEIKKRKAKRRKYRGKERKRINIELVGEGGRKKDERRCGRIGERKRKKKREGEVGRKGRREGQRKGEEGEGGEGL